MEVDDPGLIEYWAHFPELELEEFKMVYTANKNYYDILKMYLCDNNEAP